MILTTFAVTRFCLLHSVLHLLLDAAVDDRFFGNGGTQNTTIGQLICVCRVPRGLLRHSCRLSIRDYPSSFCDIRVRLPQLLGLSG